MQLKAIAPEYYETLAYHKSWAWVTWKFLSDPEVGPWSRMRRATRMPAAAAAQPQQPDKAAAMVRAAPVLARCVVVLKTGRGQVVSTARRWLPCACAALPALVSRMQCCGLEDGCGQVVSTAWRRVPCACAALPGLVSCVLLMAGSSGQHMLSVAVI